MGGVLLKSVHRTQFWLKLDYTTILHDLCAFLIVSRIYLAHIQPKFYEVIKYIKLGVVSSHKFPFLNIQQTVMKTDLAAYTKC